jgi:hypothetical protein
MLEPFDHSGELLDRLGHGGGELLNGLGHDDQQVRGLVDQWVACAWGLLSGNTLGKVSCGLSGLLWRRRRSVRGSCWLLRSGVQVDSLGSGSQEPKLTALSLVFVVAGNLQAPQANEGTRGHVVPKNRTTSAGGIAVTLMDDQFHVAWARSVVACQAPCDGSTDLFLHLGDPTRAAGASPEDPSGGHGC